MALQNRADPAGALHRSDARGMFTGNRGVIHNPNDRTLSGRRWTTKAWICCALRFKQHQREVWGRNGPSGGTGWTELFFLDEVTALAAGHRPCFCCRRAAATAFQSAYAAGQGLARVSAPDMDKALHGERGSSRKTAPTVLARDELNALPDGTTLEAEGVFHMKRRGKLLPWSQHGYGPPVLRIRLDSEPIRLVTPFSIVAALRHGYAPQWHESAA
jgi:hypothetical protein